MRTKKFGSKVPTVSVIGQGTWYIDRGDRKSAVAALRRGIELGMTHIDTAEMYGDAELVVAEAIAGRRDEVFLVSKVLPSNASRRGTIAACERSLKRLKTDRLDCYLLHWRGSHPLDGNGRGVRRTDGGRKNPRWGVSNFDTDDLNELLAVAGKGRIACNQVLYHLQERAIEHAVIPWCEKHGVAVVAYSPFGHNDFPSPRSKAGEVLQAIADAHGASPRQVALAFLTRRPSVLAIPKAVIGGTCRRQRRGRQARRSSDERDRSAGRRVSARAETARPADAVANTVLNRSVSAGGLVAAARRAQSRISASHFRTLSFRAKCRF